MGSKLARSLAWGLGLASILSGAVTAKVAAHHDAEGQVCPLDGTKWTATLDGSGTSFGQQLDLKPIGPDAGSVAAGGVPDGSLRDVSGELHAG